jgi:putative membrane protein
MLRVMKLLPLIGMLAFAASARAELGAFDQLYLRSEARGSAYELAIARLAQARATRPEVKAYADTLVNDHEAADAALRALAQKKGVNLPPDLSTDGKAGLARLGHRTGRQFDRAFIAEAQRVNAEDIRAFRAEASRTADPTCRWTSATRPPPGRWPAPASRGSAGCR